MSEEEDKEIAYCIFCRTQPATMEEIGGDQYECQDCGAILEADPGSKLGVKSIRDPVDDWHG